jgi:hypothetical protein
MKLQSKYIKVLALALGLPSTILGVFILGQELVKNKVISETTAFTILLVIVVNSLFMIVKYGIKK